MRYTPAALVISVCIFAACGGDDADPRVDGGLDAAALPGTCDPVDQTCPTGQQCIGGCNVAGVMAKVFTCALPAAGANATHGQPCGAGCAPGHDCYGVASPDGGITSVCRRYCRTNAQCPSGSTCTQEGLVCTPGETPVGRLCSL